MAIVRLARKCIAATFYITTARLERMRAIRGLKRITLFSGTLKQPPLSHVMPACGQQGFDLKYGWRSILEDPS